MKFIFVDSYYKSFLTSFYNSFPESTGWSYEKDKKILFSKKFGTSDFFSYNLNKLGHDAQDIIVNDEILQKKWANENKIIFQKTSLISKIQSLPYIYRFIGKPSWIQEIALAQIKEYKPDIVYIQDLSILDTKTLKAVKRNCRLLVGQIASPPPPKKYLKCFDLIITSFPHFVKKFRDMGIKSEYQKLAFEPRILDRIHKQERIYDISFVGSFTPYHFEGTKILEEIARHVPIHVWGQGLSFLSPFSPLRRNYHGEAWGLNMYRALAQSKIIINRHIGISGGYANNMRLYEATGMGALLITDYKKNLNDLFKVGKEILEYKNTKDLINKINYYLKYDIKREKIAEAGQKRTLKDHTYRVRMRQLIGILQKYL